MINYRDNPAINYSTLSKFYQSPDHLFIEEKEKYIFNIGHSFETLVYDSIFKTNEFEKKFFLIDAKSVPDSYDVWIKEPNLEPFYTYNKDGSLSKTHATTHLWLDAVKSNPNRTPILLKDYEILKLMLNNFFKLEYRGNKIKDLMLMENTLIEKEIYWKYFNSENDTLYNCKGRIDLLIQLQLADEKIWFVFDIKTVSSLKNFKSQYYEKYWIQDFHYIDGLKTMGIKTYPVLIFLVVEKTEPYLSQIFELNIADLYNVETKYDILMKDYIDWKEKIHSPVGTKPMETINFKNI